MIFIIDLDGTLINSSKRHYVLMEKLWRELPKEERNKAEIPNAEISKIELPNQAMPEENLQFPSAAYMKYKADGRSGRQFLMDELKLDEKAAAKIMKQWTEQIELPEMLCLDELYEDSLTFLEKIRTPENQIIYLTARQNKELVIKQLEELKLNDYANEVIVVDPSHAKQQKTEEVRKLHKKYEDDLKADRLCNDSKKTDPIIIGDTENEYELAKELELPAYILNRGFRSREYWQARSVKSYVSLSEILEELRIGTS